MVATQHSSTDPTVSETTAVLSLRKEQTGTATIAVLPSSRAIDPVQLQHHDIPPIPSPYSDVAEAWIWAARYARLGFPAELIEALDVLRSGCDFTALHIEGLLDVDDVPPTPAVPVGSDAREGSNWNLSEVVLLGVASHLGTPYGYAREHGGALVQQVVPLQAASSQRSSQGAEMALPVHTENSFAASRPDYVVMLCLRPGPTRVPTVVVAASDVCDRLTPETFRALSLPQFEVRSPDSFGQPPIVSTDVSVFDGTDDSLTMRVDLQELLRSDREVGRAALRELFGVLDDPEIGTGVHLGPGDALVVDNRRAAHGRPAFRPVLDGSQRWYQRCLVRTEFWSCRSVMRQEEVVLPSSGVSL
jgi:L-asparagine oxygenase